MTNFDFQTHVIGELKDIKEQTTKTNSSVAHIKENLALHCQDNIRDITKLKMKTGAALIVLPTMTGIIGALLSWIYRSL